jgi:nucleotide-binding universal stress UspA family protein
MNALKSILVHMDSSPACLARLTLAHQLAEQHDGVVRALYATMPTDLMYPLGFGTGFEAASLLNGLEAMRRDRAKTLFDRAVAAGMSRLQWSELPRQASLLGFVEQAFYADLLVLGQHDPESISAQETPADFVEWMVIDSGKPACVLPCIATPPAPARTVLVAWKPTRESARALSAALPFLQAAERVHVALWRDPDNADTQDDDQITAYLQGHGVIARLHRYAEATGDVGDLLLSLSSDLAADLLVMGCYGRNRTRERVMGGVSRTVLRSMTLPVLMVH